MWRYGKEAIRKGYSFEKVVQVGDETIVVPQPDASLISTGMSALAQVLRFAYPSLKSVEVTTDTGQRYVVLIPSPASPATGDEAIVAWAATAKAPSKKS